MNIFVLSEDPKEAAAMLCDKHICKMAIESAQMLSTAIIERLETETHKLAGLYSPISKHHPCTLWVGESMDNFCWLVDHSLEICDQFHSRFGHVHGSASVIHHAAVYAPLFDRVARTPFAQVVPNHYLRKTTVESYRLYYKMDKARFATWKNVPRPYWWTAGIG